MGKIKMMIVDDSVFSRTVLADTFRRQGYEVVGEASGLNQLVETYDCCKPDVVTMDIAMPGADGFACSQALLAHDPAAKIIMISSIKDPASEAEALRIGIAGYVQKPVEEEALKRVVEYTLSPDAPFEKLLQLSAEAFKESLAQNVTRLTKKTIAFSSQDAQDPPFTSQGITVVIGIIGNYSGSMIMDLSEATAAKMTEAILHHPAKDHEEILSMSGEFANLVAGIACSMLNKLDKSFRLRVSPPSVVYGAPTEVVSPKLQAHSINANSDYGRIYVSVGFKKGSLLWT
ncbi:response regulator [Heliophilum fasciatum]|uniref:Stage 0 sporulation protein A homolog n=1 Tax=Heliophilum fasciatum TaxID=35700 RepID=A0A4R2RYN4_9FIRM|nr:response regulator [Heliophilum fasciatum]MCW2276871.1 DNA-binding NarL/FixJ family response regulator [Heliophilum fasciatum]TCP68668.1 CheY-like chemotaxis protein [Heliophilum fasciatum]